MGKQIHITQILSLQLPNPYLLFKFFSPLAEAICLPYAINKYHVKGIHVRRALQGLLQELPLLLGPAWVAGRPMG